MISGFWKWALCALLTLPGGPLCFIDTPGGSGGNKAHRAPRECNKAHRPPSKIQKSWNLEILVFKTMKSGFYFTNLEQINYRKLFKPII